MSQAKKESKKSNHAGRRFLKPLVIVLSILLFLQVVIYFTSDFFLRSYLKQKVSEASGEKYEIDFDKFYISLFQRGVILKGFSLIPVEEAFAELTDIPYYKISAPEISITRLNYLFRKKELQLGAINLTSPSIEFRLEDELEELFNEGETSALKLLEEEIKKTFGDLGLEEIRIKNLFVDDADLLLQNFISQRAIQVENAHVQLKDIQLLKKRDPETPFNAEGFALDLENFEILLADSVHTVRASEVHISSLEQFIKVQKVDIIPDLTQKSTNYFEVKLEDLNLTEADINKVFYTSEVDIGALMLLRPEFSLYSAGVQQKSDKGIFDLYELIEGILGSIAIRDLQIVEGKFVQRDYQDQANHRIKANEIDFMMQNVYVGPDEKRKINQFFYAQDAALELREVEVALGDKVHMIKGDFVSLSSFTDAIEITGMKILPEENGNTNDDRTLFEINIPELQLNEADLRKIYNEGIIDIREIYVNRPEIILRDVQGNNQERKPFDLQDLTEDFLKAIYVDRFEVNEGSLVVDNNLRVRQDSLSFGKVSFVLEKFALDEKVDRYGNRDIFFAEELQIELTDYALKLADNLHVFKADRLFLDTKSSQVQIDGFSIRPFAPSQIQTALDRYDKHTALDIYVPRFTAVGVDISEAYFNKKLNINQIRIPSPKINIYTYRSKDEENEEKVEREELLNLLENYFTEVSVDSLILIKGSLNYENTIRDRLRTFAEDNVSIAVKNFFIDQNTDSEDFRSLFSEEVDLSLNNYVFSIADGKYNIVADRINFNTSREEIITSNVRLTPSRQADVKTQISAVIPTLSFTGVDLESFLFENNLNLKKVKFSGSSVNILVDRDFENKEVSNRQRNRERILPKTINVITIDTVSAENANFSLSYQEQGSRSELVKTGINLSIFDFMLDSTVLAKGDISGFFGGLALDIDEFWLTLSDSVHRVTFSKVELDTRYEGILLNNLRIIPHSLSGKPGIPVISGHVPTALIKTSALADIQMRKDLWISELRLFRPDIEIFLDEVKAEKTEEEAEEDIKSVLETIRIDEFEIVEGNLAFFDKNSSKEPQHFKGLNISLDELKFDLDNMSGFDKLDLLEKAFVINLPDYKFLTKDSMNVIEIGLATVSNDRISLQNVSMKPRMGRFSYTRQVGKEVDVIELFIPEIIIHHPDLPRLIERQELSAVLLEVLDLDATIYRDKRFPLPQGVYKFMPQELMKQVGIVAQLDTLQLRNGNIRYVEFPEKGLVPGEIYFSELYAAVYPFHLGKNPAEYEIKNANLLAMAKLNGEAQINLQGQMSFDAPYPMNINAQIGEFDLRSINSILVPNAFARIREGRVQSGDWSFTADNKEAKGSMLLLYNDLNVMLLDERTLERGLGRKKILTFVLNVFAVKSNNPRKFPRNTVRGSIYEPRNTEKFIFNYWWTTTLSGLKGSLGLGQAKPPKKLPILKRKEDEK
ncbi:AsmA family protein [Belliella aquatica]|nr:AsmA family protein [Belliella aquatica]MCH7404549.1 AsmA family protein [Belliella aquatica]